MRLFFCAWMLSIVLSFSGCAHQETVASPGLVKPRFAVNASPEVRAITEATGKEWIISTQGRASTDAAALILNQGGNIIDAAIAASFTISVERPQSTGLGGGGFMLYRNGKSGKIYAIDFRERAPKGAYENMYLDKKGEVIPDKSTVGIYAAGVPGLVRGLGEIHRRFGKKKWKDLIAPSVSLAENGLEVYPYLADALKEEKGKLAKFPASAKIFLKPNGEPFLVGEKLVQADLATSLRRIAEKGPKAFYAGKIAQSIETVTGGWISKKDLKNYRVKWREPVRGTFQGMEVVSMPPPSSGGTHVIQILNLLEREPLTEYGLQSPAALHIIASSMQRAFLDRARYMGDPDWTQVPVKKLTSKAYAESSQVSLSRDRALTADQLGENISVLPEHSETTHFSIMDREGNVVVSTQTINGWFGSAVVAPGTGILLNNEMDDFAAKPGASNIFGAIGSRANSVQPGKTPLSSMSPTIILENGKPRMALGAPGGTRIITCVVQTLLNSLVFNLSLYDSVNALRIHQQWRPESLRVEAPGFPANTEAELTQKGWKLEKGSAGCAVMAVAKEGELLRGVSEPRDHGKSLGR